MEFFFLSIFFVDSKRNFNQFSVALLRFSSKQCCYNSRFMERIKCTFVTQILRKFHLFTIILRLHALNFVVRVKYKWFWLREHFAHQSKSNSIDPFFSWKKFHEFVVCGRHWPKPLLSLDKNEVDNRKNHDGFGMHFNCPTIRIIEFVPNSSTSRFEWIASVIQLGIRNYEW